ncbi:phage putative ATP-dependent DNA helicase [Salmonella phage SPFM9]|nr:phage putative ATP-dependent DNA helicase [Salmonella phage SPFM9]
MSFRIATSPYDPTVWLFHAYNVPKHCNYLNVNEQMAGRPRKILHNEWGEIAVDKPGLVHMYISTPVEDQQPYDDFIQADFSISTPGKAGTELSRDPVFHPLMVAKYNAGDCLLLFATVAMCEFFTEYVKDNMIWDVVEKSFLKRYQPGQKYNHKLFEGKLIKENLHLEYATLYYRLDDKKFAWWASKMTP